MVPNLTESFSGHLAGSQRWCMGLCTRQLIVTVENGTSTSCLMFPIWLRQPAIAGTHLKAVVPATCGYVHVRDTCRHGLWMKLTCKCTLFSVFCSLISEKWKAHSMGTPTLPPRLHPGWQWSLCWSSADIWPYQTTLLLKDESKFGCSGITYLWLSLLSTQYKCVDLYWVCCVALPCLFVWPCLLLSFFLLISHLKTCIYNTHECNYMYNFHRYWVHR